MCHLPWWLFLCMCLKAKLYILPNITSYLFFSISCSNLCQFRRLRFLITTIMNIVKNIWGLVKFYEHLNDIYSPQQHFLLYPFHIFLQTNDLGLFRSDYFYCCDTQMIKQVEFNTIASSFGGITPLLVQAHTLV